MRAFTETTLARRPSRSPDFEAENRALRNLADELAERSDTTLHSLCQSVLALSKAGSAGVSLKSISDAGAPIFVWPAIAGGWSSYVGGTMPRDASPCGMVINAQIPLLFPRTHEFFAPFETVEPPIVEVLLAPFFSEGTAVGTVWAICHDPDRRFEREDVRVLQSISHFAAAAYRIIQTNEVGRQTRERLNLTLSNAEIVGLWDWHIPEDRVFADERVTRLFGVDTARAATGVPIADFLSGIHADDRERVREQIAVAMQTGKPYSSEYRLNAEGGDVYVVARGKCEFAPNGAPLRFPGAIVDVTEQRRAEFALHASEDQFRRLAQTVPNHVWTAAADGRLDWLNHQLYAFSGAAAESLVGRKWLAFVHPDDLAAVSAKWEQALRTGEPYEMELRLRRADGVYRWHLARAVPLDWKVGRGGRWIGTNTDIEDQKATANALTDLNAVLEERVAQRTEELHAAEQSIRQMQKIEAVGHLTGGIAHDFNNILTGITGSLELIRRRLDAGRSEGIDRYMTAALSAAQRAAGLTQRLLAFARQQSLDIKRQDINKLIASMEEMLHRTLGESIKLQTRKQPDLWPALTDANQFENALLNLVINARDAMPDGGNLTIATTNSLLDAPMAAAAGNMALGEYIVIAVSDTGVGMPPDVIDRAFDPFFTTKPVGVGTGLGLSMIYGFAQQSGGNVHIDSEVGDGTTVRLFLRRDTGEAAAETAAPPTPVPAGRGESVLVVEDDPAVRLLVGEVLDELGYRKFEAANAMEALPVLNSARSIDLLVTDVGLPHINGRQLAEIARARRPDLKVLFVTGYAAQASVRRGALEAGMDIMTKPFALDALAAKIREMIGH